MRQRAPLLLTGMSKRMCWELERESLDIMVGGVFERLWLVFPGIAARDDCGAKLSTIVYAANRMRMLNFNMIGSEEEAWIRC
mmetsp:Transcript_10775/g.21576  ORF Transcript_10775/g.21576 Transcript_10775/m.21576 type:complete len:82 (-) Transcript_10775:36-281(-)